MATVLELEARREKVRDAHLAATKKERRALSAQIRGYERSGDTATAAKLREQRDALLTGDGEVARLDAEISDARRLERAAARDRALQSIGSEVAEMSDEEIEHAERAARSSAREHLLRADTLAAILNGRRTKAAVDAQVASLSAERRAQLLAALTEAENPN